MYTQIFFSKPHVKCSSSSSTPLCGIKKLHLTETKNAIPQMRKQLSLLPRETGGSLPPPVSLPEPPSLTEREIISRGEAGVSHCGAAAQKPLWGRGAQLGKGRGQLMHWAAPCKAREGLPSAGTTPVCSLTSRARIQAQRVTWAVLPWTELQNRGCCRCSALHLPWAQSSPRLADSRFRRSEQQKAKQHLQAYFNFFLRTEEGTLTNFKI